MFYEVFIAVQYEGTSYNKFFRTKEQAKAYASELQRYIDKMGDALDDCKVVIAERWFEEDKASRN